MPADRAPAAESLPAGPSGHAEAPPSGHALEPLAPDVDDYSRQERAAIYEYDAGMSREDAERLAGLIPVDTP